MSAGSAVLGLRRPRTERLHGNAWLSWRQLRWPVAAAVVGVAAVGAYLGYCAHCLRSVAIDACNPGGHGIAVIDAACTHYITVELAHTGGYARDLQPALALLPVLVGMFVGAPLLTREYERRTHLLAWTQSVSPVRWLAVRLGLTAAVVALGAAGLNALSDWFWRDYAVPGGVLAAGPYRATAYASTGVTPVVYSLYALALGLAVGLLLRSTLASVVVTGALAGLTEFAAHLLRPYLYPAVSAVQALGGPGGPGAPGGFTAPADAWVLSSGVVLADGSRVPSGTGCDATGCADAKAYYGSYQPVSHFWPMQGVESAVVLALAAVLILVVFSRLRRGRA